jgi:hypothetical protein
VAQDVPAVLPGPVAGRPGSAAAALQGIGDAVLGKHDDRHAITSIF